MSGLWLAAAIASEISGTLAHAPLSLARCVPPPGLEPGLRRF